MVGYADIIAGRMEELVTMLTSGVRNWGRETGKRGNLCITLSFLPVKHIKVLPRKIKWMYCKSDRLRQKQKGRVVLRTTEQKNVFGG